MSYVVPILMLLVGIAVVLMLWRFFNRRYQRKHAKSKWLVPKDPTKAEIDTFLAEIEKFRRKQGEDGPPQDNNL